MNGLVSPVSFWSSSGRCCVCLVSSRFPWPPKRGPHPSLVGMQPPQPSPGLSFQHSCRPCLWPALGGISWRLASVLALCVASFVVQKSSILTLANPADFRLVVGVLRSSFSNRRTTWIVFYSFLYEVFIYSESLSICKSWIPALVFSR